MSRAWMLFLVLSPSPLWAQNQVPRQVLIQQITERFMENYRQEAALTPEQYQKFRAVAQRSFEQRRERQRRERELFQALEGQMRPGVAANADSVTKLLDAILVARAAIVEQTRADQKEFATFLSPVQRAQLFLAVERLQRMIQRQMERAALQGGGMPADQPPN